MKRLLSILSAILLVASCSKVPDDGIVIIGEPEKEQPQEQPQDVSDDNADIINRIECPKTKDGNNIIVVKKDDEYGVNYFLEWDCDKRAQRWTAYRMYKGNT
ncbi:MAG: hypothetical protein II165_05805, partial [Bacteroidales bacterium]|nr:hypothetical protein [Bacteroidales bacterium]